jgi:hypothetical protein
MDPALLVEADEWPRDTPSGEWQPLKYSNYLLSSRFGKRSRPYMVHVAKTISPTLLREINEIWGDEFDDTASHRFRGRRDVYTTFLHGHYVVERWRELLLWSWVVGRIGRDDDTLGETDRNAMWDEVGGDEIQDQFVVSLDMRHTLEKGRVREALKKAGEEEPTATEYIFCESLSIPLFLGGEADYIRFVLCSKFGWLPLRSNSRPTQPMAKDRTRHRRECKRCKTRLEQAVLVTM